MAATIKERLGALVPKIRDEHHQLSHKHGEIVISQVTIGQAIGGMRGVK